MSIDTLRTALCALVYSRLQYGIIVRGTAHKYLLQEINLIEIKQIDSYLYIKYKILSNIPIVQESEIIKVYRFI